MIAAMWLRNLEAFSLQVGLLVAGGALLLQLFRIRDPRASLAYWRTLLVVCFLLPLCQPWHVIATSPTTVTVMNRAADGGALETSTVGISAPQQTSVSLERIALIALVGGLVARAAWLVIGAWVLGRIRREATPLEPLPEPMTRAQERVGVSATMCVSTRIAGPITFGLLRPVVVFPPGVTAMDRSVQHAIACHELIHVRRRDWLFQLLEEGVRTLLWFHPAIWWLIGRIQLTREQVVDQASVAVIESRERYVEALLAVAIAKSPGIFTPAPAFLRRSLLKKRVAQILQESTMTTRRLVLAMGASAGVLALASVMAVRSFPLEAQGRPQLASTKPVDIVKGGEHLLHGELPEYPHRAIEQRVEGDVTLDIAVDDKGEVSDARVLNGPDELRKAALESVLGWHYAPTAIRSASTQATLRFNLSAALSAANAEVRGIAFKIVRDQSEKGELTPGQKTERQIAELEQAMQDPNTTDSQRDELKKKMAAAKEYMGKILLERQGQEVRGATVREVEGVKTSLPEGPMRLVAFRTERVAPEAASEVLKRSGLKVGDVLTEEGLKNLKASAFAVDEHFHLTLYNDGHGGASIVLVSRE